MKIDLNVTDSLKNKAMTTREFGESKWILINLISLISIAFILIGAIEILIMFDMKAFLIFSLASLVFLISRLLLNRLASHLILDRVNETLWYEDGKLYHRYQSTIINRGNLIKSKRCYQFEYDMSSFDTVEYDKKSKRIQFKALGKKLVYRDRSLGNIIKESEIKEVPVVFYDYTQPSLLKFLRDSDKNIKTCKIRYKLHDNLI